MFEGKFEKEFRFSKPIVGAIAAALLFTGSAAPANAEDGFDPLQVVEAQNLLGTPQDSLGAQIGSVEMSVDGGKNLEVSEVSLTPLSESEGAVDPATGASVISEANFGYVTAKGTSGTNASFIVLAGASAPTEHQFVVGEKGTNLALQDDGSVHVVDENGTTVNYILAPWAKDANGAELETHYAVHENILTQHIDTSGAAFPVTADPTSGCGVGWCSVYFNREETKAIAAGGPVGATALTAGCAGVGGPLAGGACAVIFGAVAATALAADANGNCVGVIGYGIPGTTLNGWGPFVEPRGTAHC